MRIYPRIRTTDKENRQLLCEERWAGEILDRLLGVRSKLADEAKAASVWTKEVKTALCCLGKEHRFDVCASGCDPDVANYGEWLFDLCWLDYERSPKHEERQLRRVALVAECEWGNPGDVNDDFE